jgi:hypothetical protein
MEVLAPGSEPARPSAQTPIDTRWNFSAQVSGRGVKKLTLRGRGGPLIFRWGYPHLYNPLLVVFVWWSFERFHWENWHPPEHNWHNPWNISWYNPRNLSWYNPRNLSLATVVPLVVVPPPPSPLRRFFFTPNLILFCDLKLHAKFRNPTITPSWRKVSEGHLVKDT